MEGSGKIASPPTKEKSIRKRGSAYIPDYRKKGRT
jgi:hypothetical protein